MKIDKRVFLDTNIILDFLDRKRPLNKSAQILVNYLVSNDFDIFLSEDMLTTIYYIDKNHYRVLEFFTSILFKWKIVPFGLDVVENAIELSLKRGIDFEDLLQCLCAIENNCDVFITNDKSIPNSNILVHSYEDFFEREKVKS